MPCVSPADDGYRREHDRGARSQGRSALLGPALARYGLARRRHRAGHRDIERNEDRASLGASSAHGFSPRRPSGDGGFGNPPARRRSGASARALRTPEPGIPDATAAISGIDLGPATAAAALMQVLPEETAHDRKTSNDVDVE